MGKSLENNFPQECHQPPATNNHCSFTNGCQMVTEQSQGPCDWGRQVNVTWLVVIILQNLNKKTFNDRSEVFLFFHRKPSSLLIFSHLPVGILLHQRATVNWDGDILHAVILFLVGCLKAQVGICQQKSKSSELSSGLQFYWTLKKMKTFPVCECAVNSTYTASIKGKLHCFSPICNPVKPEP